jgi:hypothetical protein
MWFLIHYDPSTEKLVLLRPYGADQADIAQRDRLTLELELQRAAKKDQEVVLLSANDEAALRQTHRRYFETPAQLVRSR